MTMIKKNLMNIVYLFR